MPWTTCYACAAEALWNKVYRKQTDAAVYQTHGFHTDATIIMPGKVPTWTGKATSPEEMRLSTLVLATALFIRLTRPNKSFPCTAYEQQDTIKTGYSHSSLLLYPRTRFEQARTRCPDKLSSTIRKSDYSRASLEDREIISKSLVAKYLQSTGTFEILNGTIAPCGLV